MATMQLFLSGASAEMRVNEGNKRALSILVSFGGRDWENRFQIVYIIRTPEWEYVGNDIHSGVGEKWESGQALSTLLSFAIACAEGGESSNLFPEHVRNAFEQHQDELQMAQFELEPTG